MVTCKTTPAMGRASPAMTFEEAVRDPNRPLSCSPTEWMYAVAAELAEEEDLASPGGTEMPRLDGNSVKDWPVKLNLGIDLLYQGTMAMRSALVVAGRDDLAPDMRNCVNEIERMLSGAIEPYLADIMTLSDKMEST